MEEPSAWPPLPLEAWKDTYATLLEFLQSTYEAAANLGGWDRAALERDPPQPRAS